MITSIYLIQRSSDDALLGVDGKFHTDVTVAFRAFVTPDTAWETLLKIARGKPENFQIISVKHNPPRDVC